MNWLLGGTTIGPWGNASHGMLAAKLGLTLAVRSSPSCRFAGLLFRQVPMAILALEPLSPDVVVQAYWVSTSSEDRY